MALGHGERVLDGECKLILSDNARGGYLAKNTPRLPKAIAFGDPAKVCRVTISLHCVARKAESLKVAEVICAKSRAILTP